MPRGRYSTWGGGTSKAALHAADRVLSKENEYRSGVKRIQAVSVLLADRIALRGDVEVALLQRGGQDEEDGGANEKLAAAEEFLNQQRLRLKALAEGNARRMRGIDSFVGAVRSVRAEVTERQERDEQRRREAAQSQEGDGQQQGGDDAFEEPPDYERKILDKIEETNTDQIEPDLQDSEFCREMRQRLGEREPKKRKGRRSEEDEEELEVINNHAGADSEQSLKCPFTGMLFENPVRNRVCRHVYSHAGFLQLMRTSGRHPCPIPGCSNSDLDENQVEEDVETAMRVHRYKKRMEAVERQRMSQELDEEEAEENGGMTVIE